MSYTMADFQKEVAQNHLRFLTLEERLEGFSADDILKQISIAEFVKQSSKEDIVAYLKQLNDEGKQNDNE